MSDTPFDITFLDRGRWQGYALDFEFETAGYYDLDTVRCSGGWVVSLVRKSYASPRLVPDQGYDKLYMPWYDNAVARGVFDGGRLIAAIETASDWPDVLRVTELWVDRAYRRRGLGARLMDEAKRQAKAEGKRAVVLETQSNKADAISFYLAQGFELAGYDRFCYHNDDVERREVRLDMAYVLDAEAK